MTGTADGKAAGSIPSVGIRRLDRLLRALYLATRVPARELDILFALGTTVSRGLWLVLGDPANDAVGPVTAAPTWALAGNCSP